MHVAVNSQKWQSLKLMEPSGLEPLTPCMPCSGLQGSDHLQHKGLRGLFHLVVHQVGHQLVETMQALGLGDVEGIFLLDLLLYCLLALGGLRDDELPAKASMC